MLLEASLFANLLVILKALNEASDFITVQIDSKTFNWKAHVSDDNFCLDAAQLSLAFLHTRRVNKLLTDCFPNVLWWLIFFS